MISAVIVAGGKGKRMGMEINKPYLTLENGGKEILALSIEKFNNNEQIDEIVVVTGENEIDYCLNNIVKKYNFEKVTKIVAGGEERQHSVYNGLINCNSKTDFVLIHDGARPFLTDEMICNSIECVKKYDACTIGVPVKDTIKTINEESFISETLDRNSLVAIQTPQSFKYELILRAHRLASQKSLTSTDDTMLVEAMGQKVKIVLGSYFNIKVTTKEDLIFGRAILGSMSNKGADL